MPEQVFQGLHDRRVSFACAAMDTSFDTPLLRALTFESEVHFVSDDGSGKMLKHIPANAYALGKSSDYFSAMVKWWAESGASTSGADGAAADTSNAAPPGKKARRELLMRFVVPIPEDSLVEAEAVVEFIYTGTLILPPAEDDGTAARCLLKAALVAESWGLTSGIRACLKQLTTLSKGATLDLEAVLPTLPHAITSLSGFEKLLRTNYQPILKPFLTEARNLVTCKGERSQQFCALSPTLIKLWADTDGIQFRSNRGDNGCPVETMIVLITRWWLAQTPAIQQDEDLCLALSHSLRMCDLSDLFLTSVMPNLGWFRGADSAAYIEMMGRKLGTRRGTKKIAGLPANWARQAHTTDYPGGLIMMCPWKLDLLVEPLSRRLDLPSQYADGFMWTVRFEFLPGEENVRVKLVVSSPFEGSPCMDAAVLQVQGNFRVCVERGGRETWLTTHDVQFRGATPEGAVILVERDGAPRIEGDLMVSRRLLAVATCIDMEGDLDV